MAAKGGGHYQLFHTNRTTRIPNRKTTNDHNTYFNLTQKLTIKYKFLICLIVSQPSVMEGKKFSTQKDSGIEYT